MPEKSVLAILGLLFLGASALPAQEEKISRTRHAITLDGQRISYTATAGTLVLRAEDGKPRASVFHIAYTKDGVKDPASRPVTFAFNGGPGAATVKLHLAAFGPRRVELDPEGFPLPPPARLVENQESILDVTDLVFVDPVSTGFSRPAPGVDAKEFHGLENDIESMAEFIRLWITRNGRWGSPKFLAGESYATTRVAGLSEHLVTRHGLRVNGVILISVLLNHQDHRFHIGNDMPFLTFLPAYTAAAWYHRKLAPELSGDLHRALEEAERFAVEEYGPALLEGDGLPAGSRRQIAEKLARYTGLSVDYIERSNLRVEHFRFCKELLRDRRLTIGRIDARFTVTDLDAVGEYGEFDPSLTHLSAPFLEATLDYLHRELEYREDGHLVYERLNSEVFPWKYPEGRYPNLAENLRQAMMKNPAMKVLVASGYYDLATPYFAARYTVAHMGLPEADRKRVRFADYDSGHMPYIRREDHRKLKKDVAEFIRDAQK